MARHSGRGRRWAQLRRRVLDRDGWRCSKCDRRGRALEVDHLKPIAEGGRRWDIDNLQVLCKGCHIRKTRAELGRQLAPKEAEWREHLKTLACPSLPQPPILS